MNSYLVPLLIFKKSFLFSWSHKSVSHNDDPNVFHAVYTKFWDKNHIVLVEGEFALEVVLKEIDGYFNSPESFGCLCERNFSFPAVNFHRDSVT